MNMMILMGIILLKNLTLRKRDYFAKAVFVSIVGEGGRSTIDMEKINDQYFVSIDD